MTYKKHELDAKKKADLVAIAGNDFAIDFSEGVPRNSDIVEMILKAQGPITDESSDDESGNDDNSGKVPTVDLDENSNKSDETEKTPPSVDATTMLNKQKRVRIRIEEQKDEPSHVPVSVNGRAYNIKRGKIVSVPESVLSVLRDCVETTFERDEDNKLFEKTVNRFAISTFGPDE